MALQKDRCHVVCHMMVSIDGKIAGKFEDEPASDAVGTYYTEILPELGSAIATGRVTNCMYLANHEVDYAKYIGMDMDYEDYIVKEDNKHYYISFDRNGNCNWDTNYFDYEGMRYMYMEVLTKNVRKEYLHYLRELKIPYIFAGDSEMDIPLALQKLKHQFNIDNLVLCGGAIINGAFFKADMIDELSLVISPYIEGDREAKSMIELFGDYYGTSFPLKKAKEINVGGVHLIFERI